MRLLDLFSCAGGAAAGYARAGFEIVGVDRDPQPRYPFMHTVDDAISFAKKYGRSFDAIHASPPCQQYSATRSLHDNSHPDLVGETREVLEWVGVPWVIENVVGAPLHNPTLLCGTEFDLTAPDVDGAMLKLVRHRLFESNIPLHRAGKCNHRKDMITASVYGAGGGWTPKHRDSPYRRGGYIPATSVIEKLLDIDWMNKHELSQSIPPAMTHHVGIILRDYILAGKAGRGIT